MYVNVITGCPESSDDISLMTSQTLSHLEFDNKYSPVICDYLSFVCNIKLTCNRIFLCRNMNQRQRYAICELFKSGKTQSEIAKQLKTTRQQVHRAIKRYKELGTTADRSLLIDRALPRHYGTEKLSSNESAEMQRDRAESWQKSLESVSRLYIATS